MTTTNRDELVALPVYLLEYFCSNVMALLLLLLLLLLLPPLPLPHTPHHLPYPLPPPTCHLHLPPTTTTVGRKMSPGNHRRWHQDLRPAFLRFSSSELRMLVSTSKTTSFPQRVFGFRGAQLLTLQVQHKFGNQSSHPDPPDLGPSSTCGL